MDREENLRCRKELDRLIKGRGGLVNKPLRFFTHRPFCLQYMCPVSVQALIVRPCTERGWFMRLRLGDTRRVGTEVEKILRLYTKI